ncbi:InlB B-repeat-containing protein [Clostridium perfringens]|uniref:InlB B-repeat-containing protein n=2 Tax=Clostridium perfringens TaxID=1502 RepID=UPI0029400813|nr:LPXTG cell wall anchor domain-containing protein [Clostridium perfringens]MDV5113065.1 LPXTG cell wall anchor domain-containing protein [Clostridium perfringens]
MKKKLIMALIVALSAQGMETVYAQDIVDTVENRIEVQEANYASLKVITEGKGTVAINGQTLTGGDVSVKAGESVRVKVNPAEGYELDKVEVNGVVLTKDNAASAMESLANGYFDYTFWGDQANSVKVTFAKVETNQTILNVTTEGKGSVEINGQTLTGGDVSVKTGEAVRVKVNPAEGYELDKVEVNGVVLTKDNAPSAMESLANGYFDYTFWGDQANSIKVTFDKVETNQTTLKATTEGKGSVEINGQTLTGGDVSVKTGEVVRVKVNPAAGYKLDKVEVNGIILTKDNAASAVESLAKNGYFDYTFWGDQANSIKVTFAKVEAKETVINVTTEGKGTVVLNNQELTGGDVLVKTGEEVRVKVNPAEGYKLDKVEVNGIVLTKDNAASAVESLAKNGYFDYTFWGDQANSIKVTFAKVETNQTILNVTTEGNGSVEINGQTLTGGDVSVKTGEEVRVKVNPAEGYKVDKVEVNGIVLTKDNAASAVESLAKNGYFDYTFWGDQANKVKVTFAKVETNQTVLNVSTEGKGTLEINGQTLTGGDVLVKTGEEVKINVNPAEGYKVDKVEVNGIVLTKDNAASAVESLANGYFNYIFWGDQANKVKVTFAKVESSDNITEDQKPENNQKPEDNQKPENNQKPEDNQKPENNQKPNEEQKPGNDQIKEELPQTGSNVNSASMGILGLTSLLGGLFIKKNR